LAFAATFVIAAVIGWFIVTRDSPNLQRFRQIELSMDLEDVKNLFPDTEPRDIGAPAPGPGCFQWVLDRETVFVGVDEHRRVTEATYTSCSAFDEFLFEVAGWVGMSYPMGRSITMP
jgi:hypothetical protein